MDDPLKLICTCLDMDEWKHTWHNSLKTTKDLIRAREVLREKADAELKRLNVLQSALVDVQDIIDGRVKKEKQDREWDIKLLLDGAEAEEIENIRAEYANKRLIGTATTECVMVEDAPRDYHLSDCAKNNAPALEVGPCDCCVTGICQITPNTG